MNSPDVGGVGGGSSGRIPGREELEAVAHAQKMARAKATLEKAITDDADAEGKLPLEDGSGHLDTKA